MCGEYNVLDLIPLAWLRNLLRLHFSFRKYFLLRPMFASDIPRLQYFVGYWLSHFYQGLYIPAECVGPHWNVGKATKTINFYGALFT